MILHLALEIADLIEGIPTLIYSIHFAGDEMKVIIGRGARGLVCESIRTELLSAVGRQQLRRLVMHFSWELGIFERVWRRVEVGMPDYRPEIWG